MFSGHTVVLILFSIYWYEVIPVKRDWTFRLMQMTIWGLAPIGVWIILANRAHYTVDIVMAIYISIGVWFYFTHLWEMNVLRMKRLRSLTHPSETYASQSLDKK